MGHLAYSNELEAHATPCYAVVPCKGCVYDSDCECAWACGCAWPAEDDSVEVMPKDDERMKGDRAIDSEEARSRVVVAAADLDRSGDIDTLNGGFSDI